MIFQGKDQDLEWNLDGEVLRCILMYFVLFRGHLWVLPRRMLLESVRFILFSLLPFSFSFSLIESHLLFSFYALFMYFSSFYPFLCIVMLPQSALEVITTMNVPYPLLFRIDNCTERASIRRIDAPSSRLRVDEDSSVCPPFTHAGSPEFGSLESCIILPMWVRMTEKSPTFDTIRVSLNHGREEFSPYPLNIQLVYRVLCFSPASSSLFFFFFLL